MVFSGLRDKLRRLGALVPLTGQGATETQATTSTPIDAPQAQVNLFDPAPPTQAAEPLNAPADPPAPLAPEPMSSPAVQMAERPVLLVYSNCQADEMPRLLQRVDAINKDWNVHYLFIHNLAQPGQGWDTVPSKITDQASIVWEQVSDAFPEERAELHRRLPPTSRIIKFPAVSTSTIWPFACADARPSPRNLFLYSDAVASALGREVDHSQMSDEDLFYLYMERSEEEMPRLGRRLEFDVFQWKQKDSLSDVKAADFIEQHFHDTQLFWMAGRYAMPIVRHLMPQLVRETFPADWLDRNNVLPTLSAMMARMVGKDNISVPVNPLVAEKLKLSWHRLDMKYQWFAHEWTFREWVVRCIRFQSYAQVLY